MSAISTNSHSDIKVLREKTVATKEAVVDLATEATRFASNRIDDLKTSGTDMVKQARTMALGYKKVVAHKIQQNPYKAVAIAAGIGLVAGFMLKRTRG